WRASPMRNLDMVTPCYLNSYKGGYIEYRKIKRIMLCYFFGGLQIVPDVFSCQTECNQRLYTNSNNNQKFSPFAFFPASSQLDGCRILLLVSREFPNEPPHHNDPTDRDRC